MHTRLNPGEVYDGLQRRREQAPPPERALPTSPEQQGVGNVWKNMEGVRRRAHLPAPPGAASPGAVSS
eukprot:2872823-Pyramimonas_sp.AAC.1